MALHRLSAQIVSSDRFCLALRVAWGRRWRFPRSSENLADYDRKCTRLLPRHRFEDIYTGIPSTYVFAPYWESEGHAHG